MQLSPSSGASTVSSLYDYSKVVSTLKGFEMSYLNYIWLPLCMYEAWRAAVHEGEESDTMD